MPGEAGRPRRVSITDEMTCRELVELVTDYLAEALPAQEQARFEEHLGTCPHCVTYLEQMAITISALGRLGAEQQLSGEAREALLTAFRDWKRGR